MTTCIQCGTPTHGLTGVLCGRCHTQLEQRNYCLICKKPIEHLLTKCDDCTRMIKERTESGNMKGQKKKDLENKISLLEDKLDTLSKQLHNDDDIPLPQTRKPKSLTRTYVENRVDYERQQQLEQYEKDYLSKIEHERKMNESMYEQLKKIESKTLPKGFGYVKPKTYSLRELDTMSLNSTVGRGTLPKGFGSGGAKWTNKVKPKKASFLQSLFITLGVVKVKEQPKKLGNLPSTSKRGTLPKGF